PSPPNLKFTHLDTTHFNDSAGSPISGLDPTTSLPFDGFPNLPAAKFTGDDFGGEGPGCNRLSLDPDGLVLDTLTLTADSKSAVNMATSPVYRFNRNGKLTHASPQMYSSLSARRTQIPPPSFASSNPPIYDPAQLPDPVSPAPERSDNQGLEGLTASNGGRNLHTNLQTGAVHQNGRVISPVQENLLGPEIRCSVPSVQRCMIRIPRKSTFIPLTLIQPRRRTLAPQHSPKSSWLDQTNSSSLVGCDSDSGHGSDGSLSNDRQIDVFDIPHAIRHPPRVTLMIAATHLTITTAPDGGILNSNIKPALYYPFLDINNAAQLAKFGLHNRGAQDGALLDEKWESLAIAPVDGQIGGDDWWFVITISDNDPITQGGELLPILRGLFTYVCGDF
ncbi:hypothetical protein HOY82DRAFT_486769, partial [Tuber indicum]